MYIATAYRHNGKIAAVIGCETREEGKEFMLMRPDLHCLKMNYQTDDINKWLSESSPEYRWVKDSTGKATLEFYNWSNCE